MGPRTFTVARPRAGIESPQPPRHGTAASASPFTPSQRGRLSARRPLSTGVRPSPPPRGAHTPRFGDQPTPPIPRPGDHPPSHSKILPLGEISKPSLPDESVKLTGNYCYLEVLDADKHCADLWSVYSLDTDGRLWTYMPQGPFKSEAEYRVWVEGAHHKADPFFYAIIDSETNKAVGVASFLRVDPVSSSIEVGWITYSPAIQQKPIATESMYLMMKYAFDLGYRRYEWKCNALNTKSRYAAQRLGFSYEGVFRQMSISKGRNRNTAWFAAIDKEWPALKASFETYLSDDNFAADGRPKKALSGLTKPLLYKRDTFEFGSE